MLLKSYKLIAVIITTIITLCSFKALATNDNKQNRLSAKHGETMSGREYVEVKDNQTGTTTTTYSK